jgi:Niemann-Pick C1 protein
MGYLSCWSFAILAIYFGCVMGLAVAVTLYTRFSKRGLSLTSDARLFTDHSQNQDFALHSRHDGRPSYLRMVTPFRDADEVRPPYFLNTIIQTAFGNLGYACAQYPLRVIVIMVAFVAVLSSGMFRSRVETNPVRLWVGPNSKEFKEKEAFDNYFGPFYRSQQVYLVNDTGPVLDYEVLKWWFGAEANLSRIEYEGWSFQDICFQPLDNGACVIQSLTQYFGGDFSRLSPSGWRNSISNCADTPVSCLPSFHQPLLKNMLFGGYDEAGDVLTSKTLVITWVGRNTEDKDQLRIIEAIEGRMEAEMLRLQAEAHDKFGLRMSFNTESSLEKELNKSSNTDGRIVLISYVFMLLYASVALSATLPRLSRESLANTRFSLGLAGVIIVLLSVGASVGFFSFLGVATTLIIAEVIPFIILAVGVDNIFLLVHELDNINALFESVPVEVRISKTMQHMGPSILLSTACEVVAFSLAASVEMPAVRNFAIYAAGAVFVNSLLQLTLFIAVLSLDQRRVDSGRLDMFPWLRAPQRTNPEFLNPTAQLLASPGVFEVAKKPAFSRLIQKYYAPALLKPSVQFSVVFIFISWLVASIALLPSIQLGLDQRLAVPSDSYLVDYFNDLYDYFGTGPPVYFVVDGANYTARATQQSLCGRFSACKQYSLVNVLEEERKRPAVSYISSPASSWIDDFFLYLNPDLDECCLVRKGSSGDFDFCPSNLPPGRCEPCFANKGYDFTMAHFPEGDDFFEYFTHWINAPSDPCPLGGKAPYGDAVYYDSTVRASHFRSAHTPLRSQQDFIDAYASARRIADSVSQTMGIDVFPYSSFYIFFAQYVTIYRDSLVLVGSALGAVLLFSIILLASLRTALIVTATVAMIVTDVAGMMVLFGVSLNALSLVNLVICVGIGVELCVHVARAFTYLPKVGVTGMNISSRESRVFRAIVNVGGSVFGGIALTKFIGVCVLFFTSSKIFNVYYFRMWMALVISGSAHALIFLPVALACAGGVSYSIDNGDYGLAGDLVSRLLAAEQTYLDDES